MDYLLKMATTTRHMELLMSLVGSLYEAWKQKKLVMMYENAALVHSGRKYNDAHLFLLEYDKFPNIDDINFLEYVQPDFFVFKNNLFAANSAKTRIIGVPDLIIEIWSKSNTEEEKILKHNLYSGSHICEHWYIEQDSDDVLCWLGKTQLESQSLQNILITRDGLEFDLRHMQL